MKAAGEVLTAKQAPHRPGAAPTLKSGRQKGPWPLYGSIEGFDSFWT